MNKKELLKKLKIEISDNNYSLKGENTLGKILVFLFYLPIVITMSIIILWPIFYMLYLFFISVFIPQESPSSASF
jgi:hypothetical protein